MDDTSTFRKTIPDMPYTPLLTLENIQKSIHNGRCSVEILRRVNFQLAYRERIAIIGPSGAGKTLLLSIIAGHIPPSHGKIVFGGVDISSLSYGPYATFLQARVVMVPQYPQLHPSLTVQENIQLALYAHPVKGRQRDSKGIVLGMRLSPLLSLYPAQLSIRQKQYVALAQSLLRNAQLIIIDGLFEHATTDEEQRVLTFLQRFQQEHDLACILSANAAFKDPWVHRTLRLYDGYVFDTCDD